MRLFPAPQSTVFSDVKAPGTLFSARFCNGVSAYGISIAPRKDEQAPAALIFAPVLGVKSAVTYASASSLEKTHVLSYGVDWILSPDSRADSIRVSLDEFPGGAIICADHGLHYFVGSARTVVMDLPDPIIVEIGSWGVGAFDAFPTHPMPYFSRWSIALPDPEAQLTPKVMLDFDLDRDNK